MAISKIDHDKCIGCGTCVKVCTADVIRMDPETGKPFIAFVEECVFCAWCYRDCPVGAITLKVERTSPVFLSFR